MKPCMHLVEIGMARGIPRPSFLEVPDLFSLLDSPRNRFYHSSDPLFKIIIVIRKVQRIWKSDFSTVWQSIHKLEIVSLSYVVIQPNISLILYSPPMKTFQSILGAVQKLCRLKIGVFWPPPPLLVVFLIRKIGNFWPPPLPPWDDIVYRRPLTIK